MNNQGRHFIIQSYIVMSFEWMHMSKILCMRLVCILSLLREVCVMLEIYHYASGFWNYFLQSFVTVV